MKSPKVKNLHLAAPTSLLNFLLFYFIFVLFFISFYFILSFIFPSVPCRISFYSLHGFLVIFTDCHQTIKKDNCSLTLGGSRSGQMGHNFRTSITNNYGFMIEEFCLIKEYSLSITVEYYTHNRRL